MATKKPLVIDGTGRLAEIATGDSVAVANGGTGQTSATAAFDALAPTTTTGDIIYYNGTDNVRLGVGSTGQVLTVAAGAPSWAAAGGGGGSTYYKDAVRVATTAAGTFSTAFDNGSPIDGVTLATGDRILIKNQSSAAENGIYIVQASGNPVRSTDADVDAEVLRGITVYVAFGTRNGGTTWQLMSSNATPIVVGTSTQVWLPVGGLLGNAVSGWTTPVNTGSNAIALGSSSSATGTGALALGASSNATGTGSVAIGNQFGSSSGGTGSVNINGASASADGCIVIGRSATSSLVNSGALGYSAKPDSTSEFAFGGGNFSTAGDAAASILKYWRQTTDATPVELGGGADSATPTNRIVLTNDSSYIFDCDIIARNTATDTQSSAWNLKFAIRRGAAAANTALIGSATKTVIGQDSGTEGWDVSVTADTTNGRPNISVTGEAAKTIRWVANIRMTKVSG